MIFLLDFDKGEEPPRDAFPKNTLFSIDERSTTIQDLIWYHLHGKHFAHNKPRYWFNLWNNVNSNNKRYLLQMIIQRTGALRISATDRPWEFPIDPPAITWNEFLTHPVREDENPWQGFPKFKDLRINYLGGERPDFLFIGKEGALNTGLPFATHKGWPGWFILCLKSAGFDIDKIGFFSLPKGKIMVSTTASISHTLIRSLIRPKYIVALGNDLRKFTNAMALPPDWVIPHPGSWLGKYKNTGNVPYVKLLTKGRKERI